MRSVGVATKSVVITVHRKVYSAASPYRLHTVWLLRCILGLDVRLCAGVDPEPLSKTEPLSAAKPGVKNVTGNWVEEFCESAGVFSFSTGTVKT